jgi:hypothetical protein
MMNIGKHIKRVEANLTKIHDDPSHAIPLGTPAVTTLEPTSGPKDEDEMTFTGAWYTPALFHETCSQEKELSGKRARSVVGIRGRRNRVD